MNRMFYPRLALMGMRSNKVIYLPYLMAGTLIVTLFYSLRSVSTMIAQSDSRGSWQMASILNMSSWVCGLLSVVILFYINSFVMKRRKKEFGLYSILGMEKRHIARVIVWETLITASICIVGGIVVGAVFSQLMFLLLLKLVGLPASLAFSIPLGAVGITALCFGASFVVLALVGVCGVWRGSATSLLHSDKVGEREPRVNWLVALLGVVTLGAGYMMALTVQTGSDAIVVFLPAVLLVITGTYCLFMAGSIALLKLLRFCKPFYYKPRNFVAVSGMIYRMKRNAVGLASICILATCLLVTLSSTVSLFIGEEEILRNRYVRDFNTYCIVTDEQSAPTLQRAVADHSAEYSVTTTDILAYTSLSFAASGQGSAIDVADVYSSVSYGMDIILLEDYNKMQGQQYRLVPGEVLAASDESLEWGGRITLQGVGYTVLRQVEMPESINRIGANYGAVVVMSSLGELQALAERVNAVREKGSYPISYYYNFNTVGEPPEGYFATMRDSLLQTVERLGSVNSIEVARQEFYAVYGSLFFVGLFFVSLFLSAAVLTIYYKQVTEGFDDRERFQIMQKVGMSKLEVHSTINRQVLMVFFLPLLTAVLHVGVAFPVICRLLEAFSMYNTTLFLYCTVTAALAFSLVYFVVYRLTSRAYFHIVDKR